MISNSNGNQVYDFAVFHSIVKMILSSETHLQCEAGNVDVYKEYEETYKNFDI